jgi:hypothetical protein
VFQRANNWREKEAHGLADITKGIEQDRTLIETQNRDSRRNRLGRQVLMTDMADI